MVREEFTCWSELEVKLMSLEMAQSVNVVGAIRLMMGKLLVVYTLSDEIVERVHLGQMADWVVMNSGS